MKEWMLSITITKKLYGWTKYGGPNMSISTLIEDQKWFCQACQDEQEKDLPRYLIPMDEFNRDFAKVCSKCKHLANKKNIDRYPKLRQLVIHYRRLKTPYWM